MDESYRIAIADDEPLVLAFLRDCLVRAGHHVVAEAQSGEQLVRLCTTCSPQLIVTDIKMKGMDGLAAVQMILERQELPVVILSAYHSNDFIERANSCHALAYLVKPIREQDLLAAIPLAMQRFYELQSLREQASNMRQALEDRKLIERAKGIIMSKLTLDEATAFRHLQKLARSHRQQLAEVARSIIVAEQAFSSNVGHDVL
jgi:two-component system, response regulator PdtaR